MWDPLAPNPILQGDPEANRRFAGALAAPAKFIVDALKRDATNQKALGRDVAYSLAQKAATPAEAVRTALGPGTQGGPGGLDMVMAAPMIARALRAAPAAESAGIRAYHGSPHDFDRFDLSKIGTGEGAQAYGHGLYFAEKEGVAKAYRDALKTKNIPGDWESPDKIAAAWKSIHGDDAAKAIQYLESVPKGYQTRQMKDAVELLKSGAPLPPVPPGRMYEVNIRAKPEEFLDWDKPLKAQGEPVRRVLEPQYGRAFNVEGPVRDVVPFKTPAETARLRDAGIPGIRYLDQGSRPVSHLDARISRIEAMNPKEGPLLEELNRLKAQRADAGATSNYVLFRDDIIDILRKYALLPAGVAGVGALGAVAAPDQAQAAPIDPAAIARALREGK